MSTFFNSTVLKFKSHKILLTEESIKLNSSEAIGAGAIISEGKKILALTATRANKKMVTTIKGAIY